MTPLPQRMIDAQVLHGVGADVRLSHLLQACRPDLEPCEQRKSGAKTGAWDAVAGSRHCRQDGSICSRQQHARSPTCSTGVTSLGCAASSRRSAMGSDKTHWRTGRCGLTWSTRWAAVCDIRRAPHDGQNPRRVKAQGDENTQQSAASAEGRRKALAMAGGRSRHQAGAWTRGRIGAVVRHTLDGGSDQHFPAVPAWRPPSPPKGRFPARCCARRVFRRAVALVRGGVDRPVLRARRQIESSKAESRRSRDPDSASFEPAPT